MSKKSWYDWTTNDDLLIRFGKIRSNAPEMNGVFARRKLLKGEFLLTWGGTLMLETGDRTSEALTNFFDVSRYEINFQRGEQMLSICPRMDGKGKPLHPSRADNPRDRCMAVFCNEPALDEVAYLDASGTIQTAVVAENTGNVCLKRHKDAMGGGT